MVEATVPGVVHQTTTQVQPLYISWSHGHLSLVILAGSDLGKKNPELSLLMV